jgi:hypothetical protein
VTGTVSRSVELVAEIAAASNEQAQGIDQINKAVAEMDKVVQQNAASAEEAASASEEMNAQAEQMKGFLNQLHTLASGGSVRVNTAVPTGRKQREGERSVVRAGSMHLPMVRANGGGRRQRSKAECRLDPPKSSHWMNRSSVISDVFLPARDSSQ